MSYETLEKYIDAVNENKQKIGCGWNTWKDAQQIIDTYDQYDSTDLTEDEIGLLKKAIESDGATLENDMDDAKNGIIGFRWKAIVSYMQDEIREELHSEIKFPCSNIFFLAAYLQRDPAFYELLKSEFRDVYENFLRGETQK